MQHVKTYQQQTVFKVHRYTNRCTCENGKLGKEDPLKRKTFDKYKKERGFAHPNDRPKSKGIETSTYKVEY